MQLSIGARQLRNTVPMAEGRYDLQHASHDLLRGGVTGGDGYCY